MERLGEYSYSLFPIKLEDLVGHTDLRVDKIEKNPGLRTPMELKLGKYYNEVNQIRTQS